MGGGVGVGKAVEWSAAAGALTSGTAAARETSAEGGGSAVEWLAAARSGHWRQGLRWSGQRYLAEARTAVSGRRQRGRKRRGFIF